MNRPCLDAHPKSGPAIPKIALQDMQAADLALAAAWRGRKWRPLRPTVQLEGPMLLPSSAKKMVETIFVKFRLQDMQDADPALVAAIGAAGSGAHAGSASKSSDAEAWTRWPLLLGLCLQSSAWGTAAYNPASAGLEGRMDGLSLCAPAFASAVTQVPTPAPTLQSAPAHGTLTRQSLTMPPP